MTKDEIFKKLDTEVKLRGLSPGTYRTYKSSIDLFLSWVGKPYELLEESDFREYLIYLVNLGWHGISLAILYPERLRLIKQG